MKIRGRTVRRDSGRVHFMADVRPSDIDTTVHVTDGVVGVAVTHRPTGVTGRALDSPHPDQRVPTMMLIEKARRHLVEKIKGDSV